MMVALVGVACGGGEGNDDGGGGSGAGGGDGGGGGGGGAENAPKVCDASHDALDGPYFVALTPSVSAKKPIALEVQLTTTIGAGVLAEMTVQPLDANDRMTKVGEPFTVAPFVVESDGTFVANWGVVTLPAEANPMAPEALVLDVTQDGSLCPSVCGMVTGEITSPVKLDLAGSTFAMQKGATAESHGEPPTLNCEGDVANSL